jgi:hypothetical protein
MHSASLHAAPAATQEKAPPGYPGGAQEATGANLVDVTTAADATDRHPLPATTRSEGTAPCRSHQPQLSLENSSSAENSSPFDLSSRSADSCPSRDHSASPCGSPDSASGVTTSEHSCRSTHSRPTQPLSPTSSLRCPDESKRLATARAELALAGIELHESSADDGRAVFYASRWAMTRSLADLAAVEAFARQVRGPRGPVIATLEAGHE